MNDAVERDNQQRRSWRKYVAQLLLDCTGAAAKINLLTKRRWIMSANNKSILILSFAFVSVLLLASWPSPSMAREREARGQAGSRGIKSRQKPSRNIESLRGARRARAPGRTLDSVPEARGPGRHNNHFRPHHNRHGQRSRSHHGRNHHRSRSHLGFGLGFGGHYYYTTYRRWVPGYYQTHTEEVLVEPGHYEWQTQRTQVEPGRYEIHHIPAVEEIRRDEQGKEYKVVLEPARTETVWVPPKYEERKVKVWVPDRYETRDVQVWVPGYWVTKRSYSPRRSWLSIGGAFRF